VSWLVTGGAGYIGSHVADAFLSAGHDVIVVDDLSTGKRHFVPDGATFIAGGVEDSDLLDQVFASHHIDGVIHLAGFKFAGESVAQPLTAYTANTEATVSVLDAMARHGVQILVFSSSCSVYGDTGDALVDETFPTHPASPYGRSKLAAEWIIRDCAQAFDLRHTSLRYFNVIGTRLSGVVDLSPHNIVPSVFQALLDAKAPRINGDDYDTPDGTCVRDYVDVGELADAHLNAAMKLLAGESLEPVYNLGSESGASVTDIVNTAIAVSGISLTPLVGPRRPGDPASIVANSDRAHRDLGWSPQATVADMVAADWAERSTYQP
jgi:UDP-glucose 4-epimerase